ncbi:hypothetical protein [Flavobacterium soli]|uniref:hypothetical protein n=1 Tax=Flavobacterium soli TaxID=344881 RepID=UPI0003FD2954|nr:hypothetical protein [Flavobacterium soli]
MKRILYENFESLSQFLNWCLKRKWQFAVVLCFASCTVHNHVSREDYKSIPSDFSGKFYDQLDTIVAQYNNRIYTKSFMKELANIDNINYSKPIKIDIKEKELYLSFEDVHAKQYVLKFYGKRHKSKFVFYTNYQTISFPIVFITKSVTKYSVFMPTDNEIMFEDSYVSEGMLLFFGAGSSSKSDNKFKLLQNE